MKMRIFLLAVAIIIGGAGQPIFAAFPVKYKTATTLSLTKTAETVPGLTTGNVAHKQSWLASHLAKALSPYQDLLAPVRRKNDTLGILSLIFGIVGIAGISGGGVLLSIAAIVLGAIGLGRNERFSLAGLILGIVGLILSIVVLALFITAFGL